MWNATCNKELLDPTIPASKGQACKNKQGLVLLGVFIKTERHDLIITTQSTKYQRFSNISTIYTPGNVVF